MKSIKLHSRVHPAQPAPFKKACKCAWFGGLVIAMLGLSATLTSADTIAVKNGSFEVTNPGDNKWKSADADGSWMYIPSPWIANMNIYGRIKYSGASLPELADGGTWVANMTDPGLDVLTQDLLTPVNAGDTLSVTFYVCRDVKGAGVLNASFLVGSTPYSQTFDTTPQTVKTWKSYTLTQKIGNSGNLSLLFSNVCGVAGWLDNIGNVTVTPAGSKPATIDTVQRTSLPAKDEPEASEANTSDNELITADVLVSLSNPSFEKPGKLIGGSWALFGSPWDVKGFPSTRQQIETVTAGAFTKAAPGGGTWCALLSVDNVPVKTPLVQGWDAGVSAGDTLTVSFYLGRAKGQKGGQGIAFFKVGDTLYTLAFDTTSLPADSWRRTTMTKKIANSGNLSLGFCSTSASGNNSFLDNISDIIVMSGTAVTR
jgi:hypothetical protein